LPRFHDLYRKRRRQCLRELGWCRRLEAATDSQLGDPGIVYPDLALVVAVEFENGFGERSCAEFQIPVLPGQSTSELGGRQLPAQQCGRIRRTSDNRFLADLQLRDRKVRGGAALSLPIRKNTHPP